MTILITGSSGHLGEALQRTLRKQALATRGLDCKAGPYTDLVGSIADPELVARALEGIDGVLHTATLHKPHVATHSRQDFVDTNITGTLNLLEAARKNGVRAFIFTSTTSVFGHAMATPAGAPAAWITEDVVPIPKNIYGITKVAAEDLCRLFFESYELPCLVLRTSRFFPEDDDRKAVREAYSGDNAKTNEFLYRRVDISDVVSAHLQALKRAPELGFGRFIISAATPFKPADAEALGRDAPSVVRRYVNYQDEYQRRGWTLFPRLDRVYDSSRAIRELGWRPQYDFKTVLEGLRNNRGPLSPLAAEIGPKGYHPETFTEQPYPVDEAGRG